MNKYLLLSIFSLFSIISCNDDDQNLNSSPIETNVELEVQDSKGTDLLNPASTHLSKNLKIYYLENGEWKLYFEVNKDALEGFSLNKGPINYRLRFFPKLNIKTFETKSLLKWNNDVVPDTITTQYSEYGNGGIVNDKVFLNGKLVYTKGKDTPVITIIK